MRSTHAIIHLQNLRHNLAVIRSLCPESRLCLAVKANAYGHGAVPVARAALACGIEAFGVATVDEGRELRQAGIGADILLYGIAAWPELPQALEAGLQLFCADAEQLQAIAAAARRAGLAARIHLKIDTGMGRLGCRPDEALGLARMAAAEPAVRLAGVCTHFPLSESSDRRYTQAQIGRFLDLVAAIRADGIDPGLVHAANSGGIGLFAEARLDMVRPGIMAYGYAPGDEGFGHLDLRPVMELRSAVSFIKEVPAGTPLSYGHRHRTESASWIGTLPVGYADGLHRQAGGKLHFVCVEDIERGISRRFPQVGTICMDQCMVNLGPAGATPSPGAGPAAPPVARWSELVVFGPQPGAETAATVAAASGTIPYEITCGISPRVPRSYRD